MRGMQDLGSGLEWKTRTSLRIYAALVATLMVYGALSGFMG